MASARNTGKKTPWESFFVGFVLIYRGYDKRVKGNFSCMHELIVRNVCDLLNLLCYARIDRGGQKTILILVYCQLEAYLYANCVENIFVSGSHGTAGYQK